MANKFGIITGASSGIGLELARIAARDGYDLLLVADTPFDAAADLKSLGTSVETLNVDLATLEAVDRVIDRAGNRPIALLCANAGHGLGRDFLGQDLAAWRHVIDTNITGAVYLLQRVLRDMVPRNAGKVLVTGSIAGFIPGSFQAVYNGTKAFIDNFTDALRNEIKHAEGVTLTTLMPGPTATEFFKRADMMDTSVGVDDNKEDPADTARHGWEALMDGKASVVSGWKNKLQQAAANVTPAAILAEQHRKMAEPGTAGS